MVKVNNSNQTIDTGKEVYRSEEEKDKATMRIWVPYYCASLANRKPEHKFPVKINMQRRQHGIPVE
jgi:hypothetical protein